MILADEPTGALDVETGSEVMDLLDEIASQTGAALVTITHDLAVAARAERQYRLAEGILVPIQPGHDVRVGGRRAPRRGPVVAHRAAPARRGGARMTGVVGAIVEAWGELRIHKLRVLLALIGVACAVAAITGVTALVSMLNQSFKEQAERQSGRSVTLNVNAWPRDADAVPPAGWDDAFARVLERYDITYASRDEWTQAVMRFPDGTRQTQLRAVDADLGVINRIAPEQGRWFTDADDRGAGTDPRRQRGVPARVRARRPVVAPDRRAGRPGPGHRVRRRRRARRLAGRRAAGLRPVRAAAPVDRCRRVRGAVRRLGAGRGEPDAGADAGDPPLGA